MGSWFSMEAKMKKNQDNMAKMQSKNVIFCFYYYSSTRVVGVVTRQCSYEPLLTSFMSLVQSANNRYNSYIRNLMFFKVPKLEETK